LEPFGVNFVAENKKQPLSPVRRGTVAFENAFFAVDFFLSVI